MMLIELGGMVPKLFFKKNVGRHSSFVGLLIPLFWTSGDVCPGFQRKGQSPDLGTLSPVHNIIFRFTSGGIPAGLWAASMATELFCSHPHTCKQALVGLKTWIYQACC